MHIFEYLSKEDMRHNVIEVIRKYGRAVACRLMRDMFDAEGFMIEDRIVGDKFAEYLVVQDLRTEMPSSISLPMALLLVDGIIARYMHDYKNLS